MQEIPALIGQFQPAHSAQKVAKDALLGAWSRYGEALLLRETDGHIVVSALVANRTFDKVLLVHHNLLGRFCWPGGHADGERDLLLAARLEVEEETGVTAYPVSGEILSVDQFFVAAHQKNGVPVAAHTHYSVAFGFVADQTQPLKIKPDENSAVRWVGVEELEQVCGEPHMVPVYRQILLRMREIEEKKNRTYERLPGALLPWYAKCARSLPWRQDREPYHVWLSEIMLQQTRVAAVIGYYERFLAAFPTIFDLAAAKDDLLFKCWEGLGYYTRARNLKKAAVCIVEQFGGVFPSQYDEILRLPGIGEYTAGAVASICFGQPTPAVDGNVLRVIARLTEEFRPVDKPEVRANIRQSLARVYPAGACGEFTQSLMELGAVVCVPNGQPNCGICPASGFCMAYQNQTAGRLPVRTPKRARRAEQKTVFVLLHQNRIAVAKRGEAGLLAGMYELPNVPGTLDEAKAIRTAETWGVRPDKICSVQNRTHIFTHVEWRMTCYTLTCQAAPERFLWADGRRFEKDIALPTAFKQFLESPFRA